MARKTPALTTESTTREASGRWAKGQSGNPGGRVPGGLALRSLARQHTEAAIKTLVEIMASPTAAEAARVRAAELILERGYGKPADEIAVQTHESLAHLSDEQLLELAEQEHARLFGAPPPWRVTQGDA